MISLLQAGWATPDQLSSSRENDGSKSDYTISVIQPGIYAQQGFDGKPHAKCRLQRKQDISPQDAQEQTVQAQNKVLARLVDRYGPSLVKLEFMAYDLNVDGAKALGTRCRHALRYLALRFEHPHIRDGPMRPTAWYYPAPGNTAWNLLAGIGNPKDIGVTGLETLILERSGITPWQLAMLVAKNPRLRVLKLRTCRGAQPEFLNWLGGVQKDKNGAVIERQRLAPGAKLEVLWLENCHGLLSHPIDEQKGKQLPDNPSDEGFEWVRNLSNLQVSFSLEATPFPEVGPSSRNSGHSNYSSLQSLSFRECACISSEYVDRANKAIWKIAEVILPYAFVTQNSAIEVDPLLS
jgi:hypothetical protein